MGQLTNLYVSSSYQGLLKLTDSTTGLTPTLQTVQDGLGGNSPLQISQTEVNISGAFTVNGQPVSFDSGSLVTTASFNAYTSSVNTHLAGLDVETGSLQSQINQKLDTGSFNTYTSSVNTKLAGLDIETGSLQSQIDGLATTGSLSGYTTTTTFNNYTSSNDSKVNSLIAQTGSYVTETESGSFVTSVSGSSATVTVTKGNGSSSNFTINNVTNATSASFATNATSSSFAQNAVSASYATNATNVVSSSFAQNAQNSNALGGISASFWARKNTTNTFTADQTISSGSGLITNQITSQPSDSLLILSDGNVGGGDKRIIFGDTPSSGGQPLGDTSVVISGSLQVTAGITGSLLGNASTATNATSVGGYNAAALAKTGSNVFQGLQTISGSLIVTGSIIALSASITYLQTVYQTSSVVFSSGSNILGDEASDVQTLNGTVNVPLGNLNITGSTTSSLGFFGNLVGNASTATSASHAVNADVAISSSQAQNAVSSSYSLNSTSASFATQALSASYAPSNPLPAGVVSGSAQVAAFGFATTGSNTFNGSQSITGSISTTQDITVNNTMKIGLGSGNVGSNIAIGTGSLAANTTGVGNIAIGSGSLRNYVTTGNAYNVAIGLDALSLLGSGSFSAGVVINNVMLGTFNGSALISGSRNTAVGSQAMLNANNTERNTAIGRGALTAVGSSYGSGSKYNSVLGHNAAIGLISGSNNLLLMGGSVAGEGLIGGSNNTIIGPDVNVPSSGNANTIIGRQFTLAQMGGATASGSVVIGDGNGNVLLSKLGANAPINLTGSLNISSSLTNALNVSGTMNVQRLQFDTSPFVVGTLSNLGALRFNDNNTFNISNYDKTLFPTGAYIDLTTNTGSNFAEINLYAKYGGVDNDGVKISNYNGSTVTTITTDNTFVVGNQTNTGSLVVSGSATITGSVQGNVNNLTVASNTASLNLNHGNFFVLALTGSQDIRIEPSNIKPGQTINIKLNTTGSGTVSFPTSVKQPSGSAYTPTTAVGTDIITMVSFDSSNLFLANVKNLV